MTGRRGKWEFSVLVALLAFSPAPADDTADDKLLDKVMQRLLSTDILSDAYPAKYYWPPKHFVKPDSVKELNAYATASPRLGAVVNEKTGKVRPVVMITQGYMKKVVKGDENLLAVIMGHELAHVMKDHVGGRGKETALVDLAFNRDQEIEADLQGMKFLVAAGFPYRTAVASAVREMKETARYSSFEGLSATHPTWEDRLALLDREQPQLWRSMGAFKNGLLFLQVEQYLAAQQCFRAVTKEFPDCHEAWANLGYALLMQYCDGLDADDLRRFGIGQMVTGAFYLRPASLESKVRGIDEKLWQDAVKALNKALTLDANLALPRANLGLAYLVHPDGKDPKRAATYFEAAFAHFQKDPELKKNPVAIASLLINSGVCDLARGQQDEAARKFRSSEKLLAALVTLPQSDLLADALLFNQSLLTTESTNTKSNACKMLEDYLTFANVDTAWWTLAHERYGKLCKELDKAPRSQKELAQRKGAGILRPLTSVAIAGKAITLSESTQEAVDILGEKNGVAVPLYSGSKIVRWRFIPQGIDILGKDKVLAIFLTNSNAPPLLIQASGVGAKAKELRIGMNESDVSDILQNQQADPLPRFLADTESSFRYYPSLGLAARFERGRLKELALAQLPRRSF